MANIIPLLNIGFPIEIARIIHGYRKAKFKQRISEFEHLYRSVFYLKQYVIPDIQYNIYHYIINNRPSFWSINYSFSNAYYRFIKYARYVMSVCNNIKDNRYSRYDIFPIDFI